MNYIITNGDFENNDNSGILFKGKTNEYNDQLTGERRESALYGEILFPEDFKGGKISFDITFLDVCQETRCGVMFGYSNENGIPRCYQVGIKNFFGAYNLDYFDGTKWSFLLNSGPLDTIKPNRKYSITIESNGSQVKLFVNKVLVFTYSRLLQFGGQCGIYVSNKSNAEIENIQIEIKKPTIFAIMKFEKDFDDLYHDVIVPTAERYGYQITRADECYTSSMIIQDIIREITSAAIIIADITMDNANVFYELGYAHALGKPTILLADVEKRSKLPFDVSGYRTIFYSNSIGGKKEVEENLKKYIENSSLQA